MESHTGLPDDKSQKEKSAPNNSWNFPLIDDWKKLEEEYDEWIREIERANELEEKKRKEMEVWNKIHREIKRIELEEWMRIQKEKEKKN